MTAAENGARSQSGVEAIPTSKAAAQERAAAWVWVGLAVLFHSLAAVGAKQAALSSIGGGLLAMIANVWYVAELAALACQALCWSLALRRLPLSIAYPFMSLVFGLNLLAAWAIFGETLHANQLLGVAIVMAGAALASGGAEQ